MNVIMLPEVTLPAPLAEVRDRLRAMHGARVDELVSRHVWARHAVVMERIGEADSVLDIGVARGLMLNALALSGRHRRLVGVDVRDYELFTRMGTFVRSVQDARDMRFRDGEFDVAVAMEVLEHIEGDGMEQALAEIRRVSGRRVITVPYREAEPLLSYHHHRFDDDALERLFPGARLTHLRKSGRLSRLSWVMIEEGG